MAASHQPALIIHLSKVNLWSCSYCWCLSEWWGTADQCCIMGLYSYGWISRFL